MDIDKLQTILGKTTDCSDEKYTFSWAGRNDTFKNIQTPSKLTLVPDRKDSVNFGDTENIFIEGENLEVLKLLQKSYFGKIKMIYIDPPYNTGKDFIYEDNFRDNIQSYLEQTGQSEKGVRLTTNPETSGRFHSDWLSFMYARLYVARNLLSDDGMIFVSIDDNEIHNLKFMMNEIFGEDNFATIIIWKSRSSLQYSEPVISSQTEYVLVYVKDRTLWDRDNGLYTTKIKRETDGINYSNPDNDPLGNWTSSGMIRDDGRKKYTITTPLGKKYNEAWLYSKSNMDKFHNENLLWYGMNGDAKPRKKSYLSEYEGRVSSNLLCNEFGTTESGKKKKILDIGTTESGTNELKQMFGTEKIFDYPKPSSLIKYLINLYPDNKVVVLDFFAGSATTAHAVLDLNKEDGGHRKFICVQIPETIDEKSKENYEVVKFLRKLKKPLNIAEIAKERIRRVVKNLAKESKDQDLGFKIFKLAKSNYKIWPDVKDYEKLKSQIKLFESPLIEKYKDQDVIYECIVKEGFSLNSKIKEVNLKSNIIYKITDSGKSFYICLDKIIKSTIISETKITDNDTLICIDAALDDSQKTELSKQCNLRTM